MTAKKLEIKRREAKRSKTKAYNILLSFAYVPRVRHHRIFFKGGINLPLHKSNQTPGFHCWLGIFLKFQDGAVPFNGTPNQAPTTHIVPSSVCCQDQQIKGMN